MLKLAAITILLAALVNGKLYPIEYRVPLAGKIPEPGDVWPKPLNQKSGPHQYTFDRNRFQITSNLAESCIVIHNALRRYTDLIFIDSQFEPVPQLTVIESIHVDILEGLSANCAYPKHEEDESYQVEAPSMGKPHQIHIKSKTVWGALRGLETLSQLIYANEKNQLLVNETQISDSPRYKYRGVLLDTARHYLPKKIILANLDAMSYNKFNTFHWHLVDDQSFPFVSKQFPNIHTKGAYTPKHIYSPSDVQDVIEYARMRGIRVIPEMDTPGHTHAMARAYPDLLTPCYKDGKPYQPDIPNNSETELLNPMRNETYEFMKAIYSEFKATFKDEFIHLGMDEVFYACWKSNPDIAQFMEQNGMKQYNEVEEYYIKETLKNVRDIGYKYIIWQDPVDNGVTLASDSIVAVWKDKNLDSSMGYWQDYIASVAKKNYQIILSACWYLNYINYPYPGMDWEKYYTCDPKNFNGTEAEKDLVIGGQANIWGEFVDKTNVLSRMWPRASAIAERLWSDPEATNDVDSARHRLDVQRCRMLRRGIPAAPILNGYCGPWEVNEDDDHLQNLDLTKRVIL